MAMLLSAATTNFITAQTVVKGKIINSATQQPLAFVSVYFKDGKGVASAEDGTYLLSTINDKRTEVIFSYGGYKTVSRKVEPGKSITMDIEMEQPVMNEVVVKSKRGKYSNKNNPAVELIRKVIDNKAANQSVTSYVPNSP